MSHGPEKLLVRQLTFLNEQDGPPERLLKSQLSELFKRHKDIRAAFLATASIGQAAGATVFLCLKGKPQQPTDLLQRIGKIFASIFGSKEHLDILFLDGQLEQKLVRVCRPFFIAQGVI